MEEMGIFQSMHHTLLKMLLATIFCSSKLWTKQIMTNRTKHYLSINCELGPPFIDRWVQQVQLYELVVFVKLYSIWYFTN